MAGRKPTALPPVSSADALLVARAVLGDTPTPEEAESETGRALLLAAQSANGQGPYQAVEAALAVLPLQDRKAWETAIASVDPNDESGKGADDGDLELKVEGATVSASRRLRTGEMVTFQVERMRRTSAGINGKILVLLNEKVITWSFLNIEDGSKRLWLANKAHERLGGLGKALYPNDKLQRDIDEFCFEAWPALATAAAGEMLEGSETDEPLPMVVDNLVPEEGGVIVYAPPGAGKSFTLMTLAVSIDAGINKVVRVRQRKTLYVNLERSKRSLQRRLGAINGALGLSRTRGLLCINARGRSLEDIQEAVAATVKKHRVQVTILDSISRSGMGDLTQNQSVNGIIDVLNGLCPTWIAIAHTPRADASHIYGSIHFDAGADAAVQLVSEKRTNLLGVGLTVTKVNDFESGKVTMMAFEFGPNGLAKIRTAQANEFPAITAGKKMTLADEIELYILDLDPAKSTATRIAKALDRNRSNVADTLKNDARFVRLNQEGSEVFYGVRHRE